MSKVFVGGVSPEGEYLLTTYLNRFMPEAIIEPLKPVGIKGKMRNYASRPDVVLVVIDESLYQACVGVVDDVLAMPKVHKYTDDDSLKQFLISWFGKLDDMPEISSGNSSYDDRTSDESLIVSSFDTQSNDAYEAKITELQDKLAQSELLINNLTMQLNDSKGDSDISAFIQRIKELETALQEKDSELKSLSTTSFDDTSRMQKAEQALTEVTTLKDELRKVKEDCSALEFEKRKLEEAKSSSETQLASALSELESLRSAQTKLEEMSTALADMTAECSRLKAVSADTEVLQGQLKEAEDVGVKLKEAKDLLSKKELEIQNLQIDVQTKSNRCEKLLSDISELNELLAEKESALDENEKVYDQLRDENSSLESTTEKLQADLAQLQSSVDSLNKTIEEKTERILTLEREKANADSLYSAKLTALQEDSDKLDGKDEEIARLNEALERYKETTVSLRGTIEELKTSLSVKEGEVDAYKRREEIVKASSEKLNASLSRSISENSELNARISELTSSKSSLEKEIGSLRVECDTYKSQLSAQGAEKDLAYEELSNRNKKLENEISSLRASLVDSKADADTIQSLNSELLEERRKSARLSSELEVLKSSSDLLGTPDLSDEVSRLKAELEEARNGINQAGISTEEISSLKEKVASLEIDLVDKTETLNELENGIFGQLANIALPRLAYDIKLVTPEKLTSKFICVASGSLESTMSLYQNLKRTCANTPQTKYLIVDLVTDTSVDLAFGIRAISTPIKWLTGAEPFTNFIADTASPNVKVISTGLAYLNDLSLLMVDWNKRLSELENYADVVIINIGCLNNLVSKVMYASFSQIMCSHIIVKATPINLRTLILVLTGFKSLNNTLVSCVNYDSNLSKPLYQKLVSKCQSQIIKDGDFIRL